jgi:hypothetical protein
MLLLPGQASSTRLRGATVLVGIVALALLFGWLGKSGVSRRGRWGEHRLRVKS